AFLLRPADVDHVVGEAGPEAGVLQDLVALSRALGCEVLRHGARELTGGGAGCGVGHVCPRSWCGGGARVVSDYACSRAITASPISLVLRLPSRAAMSCSTARCTRTASSCSPR